MKSVFPFSRGESNGWTRRQFLYTGCALTGAGLVVPSSVRGEPPGKPGKVSLLRVPQHGIQPQVVVDGAGTMHLLSFRGDPGHGDLFYARSANGGTSFSKPVRVNRHAGSAIAVGNIRGGHLAVGKSGRVHVAWMGSAKARPKTPGDEAPMLYARSNEQGTAFEPERNIIRSAFGLDGGGSVAADDAGNVYVAWHASEPGSKGEESRRVWLARSTDDGRTFAAEKPADAEPKGACGCCGMRAFAKGKGVYLLYRSATEEVHRDMYLLASADRGERFASVRLEGWKVRTCPMSSAALTAGGDGVWGAWETRGQVSFARIDPATGRPSSPIAAPGHAHGRKHAVVAANDHGETLLAWTEGMGWNRGGSVAWQVFDKDGQPTAEHGKVAGVPTWSLVAAFARPDGGFTVIY